ncbi:diphosphomevalonate decarboxylase [Candidatus Micrarchaeota archaeon]|nr:diphosphomevalonate decarboxylase [Candidatus Micrarchaeota archaeon]
MDIVTARANSNIAIIKYWGKRNEELILPTNSSISFTMDNQLSTTTSIRFTKDLKKDKLKLDGKDATEKEQERVTKFLDLVRKTFGIKFYAEVVSQNSFPKGAGLASSASGFAALAYAASQAAAQIKYPNGWEQTPRELILSNISILARQGSGSACRSIYGGAVEWQKGTKADGSDSYGVQLSPESDWKSLRNIIAILDSKEKKISSRVGMAETVKTSKLFKKRLVDVEQRLNIARAAIANKDFEAMAPTIMQDSDNMHAVMADTKPPITYMNEISNKIRKAVLQFNKDNGTSLAAYTFDAGPNANIYTTAPHDAEILGILKDKFPEISRLHVCGIGSGPEFLNKHLMD